MSTCTLQPTDQEQVFDFEIDNSSLENFTSCSRRAQYYSILKREPAGFNAALFFGSVIHKALEHRMKRTPTWEADQVNTITAAYAENPPPFEEWRTPDLALEVLTAYNKRWPIELEPFTVITDSVESSFRVLLGTAMLDCALQTPDGPVHVKAVNVFWTGRCDALINLYDSVFVMDHKTASVTGESYYEDFNLSSQMLGYVWAARQRGIPAVGLYADVLETRRPSKTGKAIAQRRQPYWYSDFHLEEWRVDTFTLIQDFLEHWARDYFPKGTKWCHGKYGECPYWKVCSQDTTAGREQLLHGENYQPVTWSPLK